jgi:aspartate racemase
MRGEVLDKQLAYWKEQLAGSSPVLELPTDRPRSAARTLHGATRSIQLSRELSESLIALSRREGVTLFMMLLAAFQTLLYRYSGQDDIVVGSPVAGRTQSEIEGLIGFFVNTLVLRTSLAGNPTFRELLGRVREVCLAAYVHQDLPFEKIVEEINPERQLNRNPLFQVMFGLLQEDPRRALALSGLAIQPLGVDNSTSAFDLSLYMIDDEKGLAGAVRFNADLFNVATITGMIGNFEMLLRDVAATPDVRLDDLKKNLTTADRELQLLKAGEATS